MAGATHRALAGQHEPMTSLGSAPWRRDPAALDLRLRQIERRLDRLEAVLSRPNQTGVAPNSTAVIHQPDAPLFPPPGALPRALDRLFAVRQQSHGNGRQLQLLYDFIVSRYPNAVADLERILNVTNEPISPGDSDDLQLHPPSPETALDDAEDDDGAHDDHEPPEDSSSSKRRRLNREP